MKHNFDYKTKWEIIDRNGNIINHGESEASPETEGTFKISFLNKDKEIIGEHEQPMKSFTVGFLSDLVKGYRLSTRNDSFATGTGSVTNNASYDKLYTMFGSSTAPTYVQQIRPIASPTTFATNAFMSNATATSTESPIRLESLTETPNYIEAVMSVERMVDNTLTTDNFINEVCLYGCGDRMIARDVVDSPITYRDLVYVRLTWTMRFLISTARTMTKNWVLNYLQNINYDENNQPEAFTDFKAWNFTNNTEVSANGTTDFTSQTFTKYQNCMGDTNDKTKGIVIGSSDNDVSYSDTHLGNQITNITYNQSAIPTPIADGDYVTPVIQPTNGTAYVSYKRDFYNNSGSTIVVNEAGVYAKTGVTTEGIDTAGSYMLCHWKTGRIELPNDCILRIYWCPQITAEAEVYDYSVLNAAKKLVVTDELREKYPRLRNISMIEATTTAQNWVLSQGDSRDMNKGGFVGWRLMTCNGSSRVNNPNDEIRVLYDAREDLHNAAVAQGIEGDDFVHSGTGTLYYWSEAENASSSTDAWCVFSSGAVVSRGKSASFRRRCVR